MYIYIHIYVCIILKHTLGQMKLIASPSKKSFFIFSSRVSNTGDLIHKLKCHLVTQACKLSKTSSLANNDALRVTF